LSITDIAARRALLDEALERSHTFPSGYQLEGLALIGFALAESDAGDIEHARRYATEAADYFRFSGRCDSYLCWALCIASLCASLADDHDAAIGHAREGISSFSRTSLFKLRDLLQVIANALLARGRTRDAARLIGAWESACTEPGKQYDCARDLCARTVASLRESKGSAELDAWFVEGRGWSLEEAIAAALEFEHCSRPLASTSYG
jgi:hypothetical protein